MDGALETVALVVGAPLSVTVVVSIWLHSLRRSNRDDDD
ncbi:hypothetical protein ABIE45_001143 [Methylobacterium sp. OAE515]|jgi:hypothetical protein